MPTTEKHMNQQNLYLYAKSVGQSSVERWIIVDHHTERVWNGTELADDRKSALLYANHNKATLDMQGIYRKSVGDRPPQRYRIPIVLEVYAERPLQPWQIIQHMARCTRLYTQTSGPEGSVILPVIEWGEIKRMKNVEEKEKP